MIAAIKRAGSQLLMGWLWDGPGPQTSFAYDAGYVNHPDAVPLDPDRLPLSGTEIYSQNLASRDSGVLEAFRRRDVTECSSEVMSFAESVMGPDSVKTAVWRLSALALRSEPNGLFGLLFDPCHLMPDVERADDRFPRISASQAATWSSFRAAVQRAAAEPAKLAVGALTRHALGSCTADDARHFYPGTVSRLVQVGEHVVERERLDHEIPIGRLAAAYQRLAGLIPDLAPFVRPSEYLVARAQHTEHFTLAAPLSASRRYQVFERKMMDGGLECVPGTAEDGVTVLIPGKRCDQDILDDVINSEAQHISDRAYKDAYPEPFNKPALDFLAARMDLGDLVDARAFYAHYVLNAYWGIFVLADQPTELVARAARVTDYAGVERRVIRWSPGEIRSPEGAAYMPHKLSMHLQPELPYFVQAAAAQLMLSRRDEQEVRASVLQACLQWPSIESDLGLKAVRGGLAPTITGGDLWDGIKSKARHKTDMVRSYRGEHIGAGQ